jgi:hypothetical protein
MDDLTALLARIDAMTSLEEVKALLRLLAARLADYDRALALIGSPSPPAPAGRHLSLVRPA